MVCPSCVVAGAVRPFGEPATSSRTVDDRVVEPAQAKHPSHVATPHTCVALRRLEPMAGWYCNRVLPTLQTCTQEMYVCSEAYPSERPRKAARRGIREVAKAWKEATCETFCG